MRTERLATLRHATARLPGGLVGGLPGGAASEGPGPGVANRGVAWKPIASLIHFLSSYYIFRPAKWGTSPVQRPAATPPPPPPTRGSSGAIKKTQQKAVALLQCTVLEAPGAFSAIEHFYTGIIVEHWLPGTAGDGVRLEGWGEVGAVLPDEGW